MNGSIKIYDANYKPGVGTSSGYYLGILDDATECTIERSTEMTNELIMTYLNTGDNYALLSEWRIISATCGNGEDEYFRIYRIVRSLRTTTIYARQYMYDLSGMWLAPFTSESLDAAISALNTGATDNYTIASEHTASATEYENTRYRSFRSGLFGEEGSILDVYGGEWHTKQNTLTFKDPGSGKESGLHVEYGLNMKSITGETNVESTYTRIVAYYSDGTTNVSGPYVIDSAANPIQNTYLYDCTADYAESTPTAAQLAAKAKAYAASNNSGAVSESITVDFVAMQNTTEGVGNVYYDASDFDLWDYATVIYPALGVNQKAKITGVTYNVLKGRYDSITLSVNPISLTKTLRKLIRSTVRR